VELQMFIKEMRHRPFSFGDRKGIEAIMTQAKPNKEPTEEWLPDLEGIAGTAVENCFEANSPIDLPRGKNFVNTQN